MATAGYASDDECEPKKLPQRFGALPGDAPVKRKLTAGEVLEYGIRQSSAGPATKKFRFLDAVLGSGHRPTPAQTQPRTAFDRHVALLGLLQRQKAPCLKTDLDLLREHHKFLREEADDDGSWEANLARRYYDRLFKEYVISDLAGYRKGNVGFRWRTQAEVMSGKGQFSCGHKSCGSKIDLKSFEVDFKYLEDGRNKRALVKVRLCEDCAYKLHYRRLKAEQKRRRKQAKEAQRHLKRSCKSAPSCANEPLKLELVSSDESEDAAPGDAVAAKSETEAASDADKQLLESLAWRGPDPDVRLREDDFDDYLRDLFM